MAEKKIIISVEVSSEKAKQTIESTAKSVDRLAKAEKELAFQQSEKGKKLAEVNEKTRKQKELNKEVAQSNLGLKQSIDPVIEAKKKLAQLQSPEAIELEKVNQQLKIQKDLNVAAAKSDLGLADSKSKLNNEISKEEQLTEKLNYELSDEAKRVAILNENLKIARQRNAEYAQSQINLTQKNDGLNKTIATGTKGLQQNRAQSGLNNAILIELGRTASDAQYGFQGMANNIGRIVELGQEFTRTGGGGILNALKTLGKSILGGGGILIGIQLLISFLPKLQQKFKEASTGAGVLGDSLKKAGESAASTVRELDDLLSIISDSSSTTFEYDTAVQQLEKNFPKLITQLNTAGLSVEDLKDETEDATKITALYREEIVKLAKAKAILAVIDELYADRIRLQLEMDMALLEAEKTSSTERIKFIGKSTQAVYRTEEELDELRRKRVEKVRKEYDKDLNEIDEKIQQASQYIDEPLKKLNDFETKAVSTLKSVGIQRVESDNQVTAAVLTNSKKRQGAIEEEAMSFEESLQFYNQLAQELSLAVGAVFDAEIQREERKTALINNQLQERLNNEKLTANQREAINKQIEANEVKLAKKRDELAEKQFKLNKAASISTALVNTYLAATDVLAREKLGLVGKIAAMTLVISTGLAQVAAIARQQFVPTALPSGSAGGAGGGAGIEAPDFNVVGASEQSQLAQTIAGAEAQPVRAFVVGKDVSTQQELDRNITNTASFG